MRKTFSEQLYSEMKSNQDIFLIVGDVGYGVFDKFKEDFPDRFINPGASEQLMIGMASGLAMDGKIPVVYSITPFILYRPFEFIRNIVFIIKGRKIFLMMLHSNYEYFFRYFQKFSIELTR